MRKILFGTIVFFSLAFLASCGGGGSGSTGATGATGAAGADGTSGTGTDGTSSGTTVPTDADLALTASTTADTDESLGQVARSFTLSGTDNSTADSRLRYYAYLGSSATTKTHAVKLTTGRNSVAIAETLSNGEAAAWPLDTRLKGVDNYTLALVDGVNIGAAAELDGVNVATILDGSISHLIVCAGNMAGDAASCPYAAIDDMGVSYTDAGGTSGDTTADNSTSGMVVPTGTGDDFQMFHSNSVVQHVTKTGEGVIASAVTDVKASAVTISGASAAHNTSGSYAVTGALSAMGTSDAVYVLVQDNITTDNGTFYYRTGTSGNLASGTGTLNPLHVPDNVTGRVGIRKGAMLLPVSSTKAYAVWAMRGDNGTHLDNSTEVFVSFLTLSAGTVSTSNIADVLIAKLAGDNVTQLANAGLAHGGNEGLPSDFPICAAARAESKTLGGYLGGTTTAQLAIGYLDDGTRQPGLLDVQSQYLVRFVADSDNFSYRATPSAIGGTVGTNLGVQSSSTGGVAGVYATQACAMTWAEGLVNTTAATDNGTLWWAGVSEDDNGSDHVILASATNADNGSLATFTTLTAVDYTTVVNQVALSYDYLNRPYLAALLDNGSVRLHWSATGSAVAAYNGGVVNLAVASDIADSAKPIALVRSANGKQLALSYHTAATVAAGNDMKVVVIYADGSTD